MSKLKNVGKKQQIDIEMNPLTSRTGSEETSIEEESSSSMSSRAPTIDNQQMVIWRELPGHPGVMYGMPLLLLRVLTTS